MRPSYDAEHPYVTTQTASTTPIYDELYSEYRRLFRALPGDRTGEEDLGFTAFAIRDGHPLSGGAFPYPPPQHQQLHQQHQQQAFHTYGGPGQGAHGAPAAPPSPQFTNGQGWVATGYLGVLPNPTPNATPNATPHPTPHPVPHMVPAPPPPPSPVLGTVTGPVAAQPAGGRHRQMLSLPPGRAVDHH
ncbi:hypothetical protein ACPC54_37005 [Kitasatospora sp. NPDC094028]